MACLRCASVHWHITKYEGTQSGNCSTSVAAAEASCNTSNLFTGLPEIETGCPELRSINLNGCMTLFRLALEQQPQLDRVEASGCKALRIVISNSSVLGSCYLQACPRLAVSLSTLPSPYLMRSP